MALKFGSVSLTHGVMLAPMAGVGDASFRLLCRRFGAEYTVSEMVSAKALCFEQQQRRSKHLRTAALTLMEPAELPAAVQLFGGDPDFMAQAAALLTSGEYRGANGVRPSAIDVNMGCPVHKIVGNGEGSALMLDPDRAEDIVRAMRKATDLPLTVKIRAGFDDQHKNAPELAKRLEAAGADLICVHGRTRQQYYAPSSDNRVIAAVKAAVSIPVIGNGDLFSADDVVRMKEETGCDGVMIARGSLGNPFLFEEVIARLEGRPYTPPTPRERLRVALEHAADMAARKGDRAGYSQARGHMIWYCKGLHGAAPAREALSHADSLEKIEAVFQALLEANE